MFYFSLVVKGSREQAEKALESRGFLRAEYRNPARDGAESVFRLAFQQEERNGFELGLARWFVEDCPRLPPYPAGSLLWYGSKEEIEQAIEEGNAEAETF